MDDENNEAQGQSDEQDETLTTQDMDEVAGGGCMVFVDTAGCSGGSGGVTGGATVIVNSDASDAAVTTGGSTVSASDFAITGGISGGGPFPTVVGVNFDALLQALGVPAAPNAGQSAFGLLPPNYPTSWSGLR